MDAKKIAAKIAAAPGQSPDPAQIWEAMSSQRQTAFEAVWYVPGDEDTIIVTGGTEAEMRQLAQLGRFDVRLVSTIPFEAFKRAVTGQ